MKVILIKNAVETLGYFSEQLAETFQEMGHDTYFVDYDDLVNTVDGISRFAVPEKTVLCTFNFIGLSGEEVFIEENGRYIWENQGIACINILVDHPLYYHSKLAKPPVPEMRVFCIDREHVAYMKRFYPALPVEFLPLAGNCILEREVPSPIEGCHGQKQKHKNIPYQKRKYDIVFTGNYTPVEQAMNAAKCFEIMFADKIPRRLFHIINIQRKRNEPRVSSSERIRHFTVYYCIFIRFYRVLISGVPVTSDFFRPHNYDIIGKKRVDCIRNPLRRNRRLCIKDSHIPPRMNACVRSACTDHLHSFFCQIGQRFI